MFAVWGTGLGLGAGPRAARLPVTVLSESLASGGPGQDMLGVSSSLSMDGQLRKGGAQFVTRVTFSIKADSGECMM